MDILPNAADLIASVTAIDGTIQLPALIAAGGLLSASFLGLVGLLRSPGRLPPEARNLAARLAAKAEIGRVATTSLHDARIDTPIEALVVDHLVKAGGGAVLVGSVALDGDVSGGARDPIWTITKGRETSTIPNPMIQVAQRVQALRQASHGALPVTGLVLYAGTPRWVHGAQPEGVAPIREARAKIGEIAAETPVDAPRSRAWSSICSQLLKMHDTPERRPPRPDANQRVVSLQGLRSAPRRSPAGEGGGAVFAFPGPAGRR